MTDSATSSEKTTEETFESVTEVTRETPAQHLKLAFIKNTKVIGMTMIIIGVLSILLPNFIGMAFNTFVGGIFLLASLALALNAWHNKKQHMSLWFKPFVLAALALIIFMHPAIILGVLGLLIAIYFLISGFSSMVLSFELQSSAKIFSLLNGFITLVLGVVVLTNWPFSSAWIIGLIIGVTFIFDGIALLSIANQVNKTQEKLIN
ncbi:HdeD family acid-resistance protein [Colwellia sp. 12G3]|uniref:HdeD family acid-resistance protein n=1 Tax=Colwellia sp. 12G3 TaxID=2058299 RepID=UPI000C349325|nr:DUF308 domain-containing protein [Colwellia sp. 12G3]PKI13999.1 hypothetical protein CXF71_15550 [Colwellia sp. 12G3]